MERSKNTASIADIVKCLKANDVILDSVKISLDMDDFIEEYCDFLCDALLATPRLSKPQLILACLKSCKSVGKDEAEAFASKMLSACTYCSNKKKSMTTGVKLSPAVRRVIRTMELTAGKASEETLFHKARQLRKDPSSPKQISVSLMAEARRKHQECKVPLPLASGSSSSSSSSRMADIFALYGQSPPKDRNPQLEDVSIDIVSSYLIWFLSFVSV